MNHRFWLGFVAGVTIIAAIYLLRTPIDVQARPAEAVMSERQTSAAAGRRTSVTSGQRAALERDLALARQQAVQEAATSEDLKGEIALLEADLKDIGSENIRLRDKLAQMPSSGPKATGKPDPAELRTNLRVKLHTGKELPAEVAAYLGLNDGQRKVVSDRLKAEGPEIYALLRRLASENPSARLPASDGVELVVALQTGSGYGEDQAKVNEFWDSDPGYLAGDKLFYLEDVLEPTSRFFRMAEASIQIRARTLEELVPILSGEQHQKLASLLGSSRYNFDGIPVSFAYPPPRRPR